MYLRTIDVELAVERLQMTRATINAIAASFAKKDSPTPAAIKKDIADALLDG